MITYIARELGSAVRAEISIILATLACITLVNNIVAGGSMSYLATKIDAKSLLKVAYSYTFIVHSIAAIVLSFIPIGLPIGSSMYIVGISAISGLFYSHCGIYSGTKHLDKSNILQLIMVSITTFLCCLLVYNGYGFQSFLISSLISISVMWVYVFVQDYELVASYSILETYKACIHFGAKNQIGHIAQFFSSRYSFYILSILYVHDKAEMGVFTHALSLMEATWLLSNSLAGVLYNRILQNENIQLSQKWTNSFVLYTALSTALAISILIIFPSEWYIYVFKKDFQTIKQYMYPLVSGTFLYAIYLIIGHYISAIGKPQWNSIANITGAILMVSFVHILGNSYTTLQAAWLTSVCYSATSVVSMLFYFYSIHSTKS